MKKFEHEKAWFLGMKKFFRIHDYFENMMTKVATYSLKGKLDIMVDIWWEYLKNVKSKTKERLTWSEFEDLFRDKYLLDMYYENKEKEFYELRMGKMSDEEYIAKFLELLRYVPYLKDEKENVQRFISGLPLAFKDLLEILEPQTLDDAMKKLKHCDNKEK